MVLVYFLPVLVVDEAEQVAGIEFIHAALLDCTLDPSVRCLIQDTTPPEHDGLVAVALSWRDAEPDEIDRFHSLIVPYIPDPDTLRAQEILGNPAIPIPAPDLAELVRIFGRRLGYRFV